MKLLDVVRRSLGCGAAVTALALGAPAFAQTPASAAPVAAAPMGPGSLNGLWTNASYKSSARFPEAQRVLETEDNQWPPLQPWAKTLLEQRIKDSIAGRPFSNTLAQCLPGGIPQMLFGADYPIQIVETPGAIFMMYEEQNHFRVVRMNQQHLDDPDPTYMGDSVGHWEGATLVIDTIGLTEQTTLDQIGMPHSDRLHVVERYRRTQPDRMEIEVSLDDPKTFTAPWTTKAFYRLNPPGTRMQEYICANNRNVTDGAGHQGFQGPGH